MMNDFLYHITSVNLWRKGSEFQISEEYSTPVEARANATNPPEKDWVYVATFNCKFKL